MVSNLGADEHSFEYIESLINISSEGDIINLSGVYKGNGNPIMLDKNNLTFNGYNNTILDANCLSNIFSISGNNIIFNNISFINGFLPDGLSQGGAIYNLGNNLEINDCNFINNTVGLDMDSGIICTLGDTKITNSNFTNNKAYQGAAIYSQDNKIILNDCNFRDNSAYDGGAICINMMVLLNI